MAYWLHMYPEIYFQKVKREDISNKVVFATVNLLICAAVYYLKYELKIEFYLFLVVNLI